VSGPLRLLVADDHPVYRDGLRLLLSDRDGIEVVATATSGEEAVALAASTSPDVVIMDLRMGGLNGIEATRQILAAQPATAVLVLTMFEDDESVFAAMRAGARGYLLKGADEEEILHAVRTVARGEAIFGAALAARIAAFFAAPPPTAAPDGFPALTARELEVLTLVAQGLSNGTIAARLYLSHKTVRNHVSNIFAKLQVADRAEAIVRARRAGLGVHGDDAG
jgi:DNA-binding NarL/FixJ family response regulator